MPKPSPDGVGLPQDPSLCPICRCVRGVAGPMRGYGANEACPCNSRMQICRLQIYVQLLRTFTVARVSIMTSPCFAPPTSSHPGSSAANHPLLPLPPRRKCSNPAQVATSGFVFCYPCVFAHVMDHGRCPVSGVPATLDHIRKLYEDA